MKRLIEFRALLRNRRTVDVSLEFDEFDAPHAMEIDQGPDTRSYSLWASETGVFAPFCRWRDHSPSTIQEDIVEYFDWFGVAPDPRDFSLVNGVFARRVAECMWEVSLDSRREDRLCQVELSLRLLKNKPAAASDAANVYFKWHRKEEALAFAQRAVERHGGQKLICRYPNTRTVAIRPDLLTVDDALCTVVAAKPGISALLFRSLSALPRGAVEAWLNMRKAGPIRDRSDCTDFTATLTSCVDALAFTEAPLGDADAAKWLRRARHTLPFVLDRMRAEPNLRPAPTEEDILRIS